MSELGVKIYKRLATKFVAIALALFLLPQAILYFYSTNTASSVLVDSLRSDLTEKAFLVGSSIDRFYTQRENDVRVLSQSDVFEGDDHAATNKYLIEISNESTYLNVVEVVDREGIVVASSGEHRDFSTNILRHHPSLANILESAWSAKHGDVFVSDIVELDSGPGLVFLTPITDNANATTIKILLVEINLSLIADIVADFNDRVIGDKYVYLVDNAGNVIVSADPNVASMGRFPDLDAHPQLLDSFARQGSVGSLTYDDVTGRPVMAGFADMAEFGVNKAMDWGIIAIAPMDDITRPVAAFKKSLLLITVAIGLAAVVLMFMTSRSIVGSVHDLVTGARRVTSGEVSHRMDIGTQDEFGFLAGAINDTLDKLVEAQESAVAASSAKSDFLAMISHEIRTPMNGVVGLSQMLKKTELDEDQRLYVDDILSSGRNMVVILNDILDISKIERGLLEIEETDFEIERNLESTVTTYQQLASEKGILFEAEFDVPEGFVVRTDNVRLRQIVGNLLSNAIKFTSRGMVTMKVATSIKDPVDIDEDLEGAQDVEPEIQVGISISVRDTGIGMSAKAQEAIFEPFRQADSSITRSFGGTGLGLSIVSQLADLMGGEVTVSSEAGIGSLFKVELLAKLGDKSRVEDVYDPAEMDEQELNPLKILLAEDQPVNATVAKLILSTLGHDVQIVVNGKEAYDAVKAADFDLVILDNHMPVMDGGQAVKKIRKLSNTKKASIPIVGLTADAFEHSRQELLRCGMNEVLTKPLEEVALQRCLAGFTEFHAEPNSGVEAQEKTRTDDGSLAGNPGVLDVTVMNQLRGMVTEEEFESVHQACVQNLKDLITELKDVVSSRDVKNLSVILMHNISGVSGTFGAKKLAGLASTAEASCKEGTVKFEDLEVILECAEEAEEALREFASNT